MKTATITIVSGLLWATTTLGNNNDNINFDQGLIPCLDEQFSSLPIYTLDQPTVFPSDKFDEILGCAAPGRTLNRTQTENRDLVYDGDRLVGFVDHTTGESTIFPQLGALNPAEDIPVSGIQDFISDENIFPHDDTTLNPVNGSTLSGSTKNTTTDATPPAAYLKDVYVDRTISYGGSQFPSCGNQGNKAYFSFGAEGNIYSLTHRWRAARLGSSTVTPLSKDKIYNAIKDQLCTFGEGSTITVTSVDVCVYESGGNFMQLVYRFTAAFDDGSPDTPPFSVIGYTPAGDSTPESVPAFTPLTGQGLPTPIDNSTQLSSRSMLGKRAKDITVGRYVAQGEPLEPRWTEDADYIWEGLQKLGTSIFDFISSQYYLAQPVVYTTLKNEYINSVQLAYTVGHGSPHTIYTDEYVPNYGEVDLSTDIGDGYGPGAGGSLVYWIIKGCNVTLSPEDLPGDEAFDPWWNVFNGLHAIMSYRSYSWSADAGEGNDVGSAIASGASVLFSWMKGVNQNSYLGLEKASSVTVCGHADDTLWQTDDLGRPGCLQIWWYSG